MKKLLDQLAKALGYVPRYRTIQMTCAWCGKVWDAEVEGYEQPSMFCTPTHRFKNLEARRKRKIATENQAPKPKIAKKQEPAPVDGLEPEKIRPDLPKIEAPKCECTNHMGGLKRKYPTNAAASMAIMKNHLRYGPHRVYRCPVDENIWHVTSRV